MELEKEFDNDCSIEGFIKEGTSVLEIIASNQHELEKIGGSFKEIGNYMYQIINKVISGKIGLFSIEDIRKIIKPLVDEFDKKYGKNWSENKIIIKEYRTSFNELMATIPENKFSEKVAVVGYPKAMRGQKCPYHECDFYSQGHDIEIYNPKTKRGLIINKLTAHLAREHDLLQNAGNRYSISARAFYENFMPNIK
jgi:hypothetical protein